MASKIYKKARSPRQAQADYTKRRAKSSALAPGLPMPAPPKLGDYSKLSTLTLATGMDGPLVLKPIKRRKPPVIR